jgi:hypothetical protein
MYTMFKLLQILMLNLKPLLISIICVVFLVIISLNRHRSSNISSLSQCPSSLSQTCLQSYDARILRKSLFHISMVHFKVPTTLSSWVENKTGFEIGAPSVSTWGTIGIYDAAATIDATNFANQTLWERGLKDGSPFIWKNQVKGTQYIRDGVDLHGISNEIYDFVCAADVLEHIANPFKALLEWIRIIRSGGLLLLIVPFKNVTFDHKRDVVRIEHLIDDYKNQITEADLSHLDEIVRLHDIEKDWAAGGIEAFKKRSQNNFQLRGLHQHVYDQELLYYIFLCLNLDIKIQITWDYHNLIICQKR